MAKLPEINPIDAGYMNPGGAVDHLRTETIFCQACGSNQKVEIYRMILGRQFGFGAPHYISPFLKRSSTKGKIGKRGIYALCCECQSLWSQDQGARESLENLGADPDGVVADHMTYEVLNRSIQEEAVDENDEPAKSKVRKLPPDAPPPEAQPKTQPKTQPKAQQVQSTSRSCPKCGATTTIAEQRFCEQCGTDLDKALLITQKTPAKKAPAKKTAAAKKTAPPKKTPTKKATASSTSATRRSPEPNSNESAKQDEVDELAELDERIQDLRRNTGDTDSKPASASVKDDEQQLSPSEQHRAKRARNRAVRSDPEVQRLREELKEAENRAREQKKQEELKKRQAQERERERQKQEELKKQQQQKIDELELERDAQQLRIAKLEAELGAAEAHLEKIKAS